MHWQMITLLLKRKHRKKKGGIPSWIWILLAAAVAFFVFRKLGAKKS
jgi:hypothetical protein